MLHPKVNSDEKDIINLKLKVEQFQIEHPDYIFELASSSSYDICCQGCLKKCCVSSRDLIQPLLYLPTIQKTKKQICLLYFLGAFFFLPSQF